MVSREKYPKLDQKPCGRALMVASVSAPALPKRLLTVQHPTTAEITARVQMARCGVRLRECSLPMESGNSSSRSEEHTSELQSLRHLVCRLLLEKKKIARGSVMTVSTKSPARASRQRPARL